MCGLLSNIVCVQEGVYILLCQQYVHSGLLHICKCIPITYLFTRVTLCIMFIHMCVYGLLFSHILIIVMVYHAVLYTDYSIYITATASAIVYMYISESVCIYLHLFHVQLNGTSNYFSPFADSTSSGVQAVYEPTIVVLCRSSLPWFVVYYLMYHRCTT